MAKRATNKRSNGLRPFAWLAAGLVLGFTALLALIKLLTPKRETLVKLWAIHAVRTGAILTVCAGLFAGTLLWMRSSLAGKESYILDPARISLQRDALSWVGGKGAERIEAMIDSDLQGRLAGVEATNAFDGDILGDVAEHLAQSPWVARVDRVLRRFPRDGHASSLDVQIAVRKPVALVEYGETIYLVDREGVLLPYSIRIDRTGIMSDADRMVLEGLTSKLRGVAGVAPLADNRGAPPAPGKRWDNEQVAAAISVEQELRAHKVDAIVEVRALDVSDVSPQRDWQRNVNYTAGGGVRLLLAGVETPIIWGKAPIHANSVEPSVTTKIERLGIIKERDPQLRGEREYYLNRKL